MEHEPNPYEIPLADSKAGSANVVWITRIAVLTFAIAIGLAIGSYISVEIGYAWYPDATRTGDEIATNTIAAILGSPVAMTFGIFPSLGFYGPFHGLTMILGFAITSYSTWLYYRSQNMQFAWLVCLGMILWSHNNHLAYSAIMSV